MTNTLLGATAVIALTAGAATGAAVHPTIGVRGAAAVAYPSKAPGTLLYNQNSGGDGYAILSQNFTSGSFSNSYDAAGADDFVLAGPARMTGVDVTGVFFNGSGPANGAVATLYAGKNEPTTILATGTSTGGGPNFFIPLKRRLKAGRRYWVSVAANCSFTGGCGEWGWELRTITNKPAMWENPGGGFGTGCFTWEPLGYCGSSPNADFMFDIRGRPER